MHIHVTHKRAPVWGEIQPESLHQRTPFFIGSPEMVTVAEEMIKKYGINLT